MVMNCHYCQHLKKNINKGINRAMIIFFFFLLTVMLVVMILVIMMMGMTIDGW